MARENNGAKNRSLRDLTLRCDWKSTENQVGAQDREGGVIAVLSEEGAEALGFDSEEEVSLISELGE